METTFGLRGAIMPHGALGDFTESFVEGPFQISVNNGVIEIGFEDESLRAAAKETVEHYIAVSGFVRGQRLSADLNQWWRKNAQGSKDSGLSVFDKGHVTDDLRATRTQATITGGAFIIRAFDSRSLANQRDLIQRSYKDPALAAALRYFNDEVIAQERPLYGIYKALEALTRTLGKSGRAKLARLAGENEKYVDDVMETAQTMRHHDDPNARQVLTEAECKARAKILISAYAKSITLTW
jgi:hypothetical protein